MTTRFEFEMFAELADEALKLYANYAIGDDKLTVVMDLDNAHKDCPMRLDWLLAWSKSDDDQRHADWVHDMVGIRTHMDRSTGKLMDCFVPRCAI